MRKKEFMKKILVAAVTVSTAAGAMPLSALAVTADQVAADGTYSGSAEVEITQDDLEWGDEWNSYSIDVSVVVENGVFQSFTVTPGAGYDEENRSYLNNAQSSTSEKRGLGISEALTGQPATADNVSRWDGVTGATRSSDAIREAVLQALESAEEAQPETEDVYVLMNIPYADFYQADLKNEVQVDTYTSATLNKSRTGSLANGSYHVDPNGTDITGAIFPVKLGEGVTLEDLADYTRVTDASTVSITVTNRGQTNTTEYTGSDALFESDTYSYYVLSETPAYYKELTVDADGGFSFGEVQGDVQTLSGVTPVFTTDSNYGDYQLDLDGLTDQIGEDLAVYGVILHTEEGHDYGLRHMENIWRISELAWCTGFTDTVHGCRTSSAHYEGMMGETITGVTYYTENGLYHISVGEIYVPVKFEHAISVSDAAAVSGQTVFETEGLPEDYDPVYEVEGLSGIRVDGQVLSFDGTAAEKGSYTLTVRDRNGKYADISADFELYTEDMPAAYNEDGSAPALVPAEGSGDAEFADYISSITSVNVNGTDYAASGRGAVKIVQENGTIDTSAAPFADGDTFEITVTATGYLPLQFVYRAEDSTQTPSGDGDQDDSAQVPAEPETPSGTDETPSGADETPAGTDETPSGAEEKPSGQEGTQSGNTANDNSQSGTSGESSGGGTTADTAQGSDGSQTDTQNTQTATGLKAVQTSDGSRTAGWIGVFAAAGCAVLAVFRKKRLS